MDHRTAVELTEKLEEFIRAVVTDATSPHVEDSIRKSRLADDLVTFLEDNA